MIDWKSVVSNSLTMIIGTVFIGAGATIWESASKINEKISKHTESIVEAQRKLEIAQAELKATQEVLFDQVAELMARRISDLDSESDEGSSSVVMGSVPTVSSQNPGSASSDFRSPRSEGEAPLAPALENLEASTHKRDARVHLQQQYDAQVQQQIQRAMY